MGFLGARLHFGFENPNLAGTLLAMLALGAWVFCEGNSDQGKGRKTALFALSLGLSGSLTAMMSLTASRGALIAWAGGALAAWWTAGRPRPRRAQWAALGLVGVFIVIVAALGSMDERIVRSSGEDGSIESRLAIYDKFPAMVAAAPGGWGAGQSAAAYQNWFQDENDSRIYKHLISTHVIWLVERGWVARFFYVFAWLAALRWCSASPAAFGIWVAFGIAGFFSHVGGDWKLWIVPAFYLGWAWLVRRRTLQRPQGRDALVGLGLTAFLLAILFGAGLVSRTPVERRGKIVSVAGAGRKVWFIAPDRSVLGTSFGKVVRRHAPAAVAPGLSAIPQSENCVLILSGKGVFHVGRLPKSYELIWLNPPARLSAEQQAVFEGASIKTIYWGELRTDANAAFLRRWSRGQPNTLWRDVVGEGLLLSRW